MSLIILSYTIDFCFSLQSYYSGTKCELREQALFVSEKIRVTRRWRWRCQRMPKTLWETVRIWKERYVAIHTMTCIHTYIQPESYFMIEKKNGSFLRPLMSWTKYSLRIHISSCFHSLLTFSSYFGFPLVLPAGKECAGYNHRSLVVIVTVLVVSVHTKSF